MIKKFTIFFLLLSTITPVFSQNQNIAGVINSYTPVTAIYQCAVDVADVSDFTVGCRVVIIQMKGASVDTMSNNQNFGDILSLNSCGNYEFAHVSSILGNTIYLTAPLQRSYEVTGTVQLIKVPQFINATVTSSLNCPSWNGSIGGVIIIECSDTLTLNDSITVKDKGFKFGDISPTGYNCPGSFDFYYPSNSYQGAEKGEGISLLGALKNNGMGKRGNGGGGGNNVNAGGGGGANFGAGGNGGNSWEGCPIMDIGGRGGQPLSYSNALNKIFFGGGGGGGQQNNLQATPGTNGGGIIIIRANSIISNAQTVDASTSDVLTGGCDGTGGGGGGGTVVLDVNTFNGILNINAKGGDGAFPTCYLQGASGGGGGGCIWSKTTLPNNVLFNLNAGLKGNHGNGSQDGMPGDTLSGLTIIGTPFNFVPLPIIVSSNDTICNGAITNLEVSPNGLNYTYNWSNGISLNDSTIYNPIAAPSSTTTYSITLSDPNGCTTFANTIITINQLPILSLTNDTAICNGTSLSLAVSGANTYLWSPTNNLNTTSGSFVITNTTTNQKYFVNGTDNNGCTSTDSVSITIDSIPIPVLSGTSAFCLGDSATINVTGGNHYLWSNGDTTASITVAPSINTPYSVIVTNSFNCLDSATFNTIVHAITLPNFTFNYVCYGANTIFNNTSNINTSDTIQAYNWNFGDASPSDNTQNPSHLYPTDSSYNVTLTATSNFGCTDSITKTVIVNPNPIVSFSADDTLGCAQLCVNFSDSSTIHTGTNTQWTWDFGDTSPTDNTQNANHCFYSNASPASYSITLTVTSDSGCVASFTKNNYITIHTNPVALFSASNVCFGNNILFNEAATSATSDTVVSWTWNFGDNSPLNNNQNIPGGYLYDSAATYITSLLVTTNIGCKDSITHTITVNTNPTANFTVSDTSGCEPLCISFLDASTIAPGSNISQWIWNVGDGSTINSSPSFEHCYNNDSVSIPILFSLSLTAVSDSGCSNTINKNNYITVYPISIANFSTSPTTADISNPLINITNLSVNADSNHWHFGDNQTAIISAPNSHEYSDTGTYTITLITNTTYGCADTAYQTIIIEPDFILYIPSAFSPNEDGINDSFIAKGDFIKEFEMDIFDRWGNLIYKTADMSKAWNGKVGNGIDAVQTDVYVYSIKVTDFKDKKQRFKGIVTLIK